MNINFKPEHIAFHTEDSDGMCRFINSLTADQARACVTYELSHQKRNGVLALLSSQVTANLMRKSDDKPATTMHRSAGIDMGLMSPKAQAQILTALQLARAHVRFPLDGNALADLKNELDTALAVLGVH